MQHFLYLLFLLLFLSCSVKNHFFNKSHVNLSLKYVVFIKLVDNLV
jgi:hypothetical protein